MASGPKAGWFGPANVLPHLSQNGVQAFDCFDVPSQRQHIAPIAVRMKQRFEQAAGGLGKRSFEPRKPILRSGRGGFCFCVCQRSRSPSTDLRSVSGICKLHRSKSVSEGAETRTDFRS